MLDEQSNSEQPTRHVWRDRVALLAVAAAGFTVSRTVNVHERLHGWAEEHPRYDPYQLLPFVMGAAVLTLAYLVATRRRLRREIAIRRDREEALGRAVHEVDVLSGLLSMCASCKRIRDEDARWEPVEAYLQRHGELAVSHDLCPACAHQLYPDYVDA